MWIVKTRYYLSDVKFIRNIVKLQAQGQETKLKLKNIILYYPTSFFFYLTLFFIFQLYFLLSDSILYYLTLFFPEELFVLKVEPDDYEGLVIDGCTFLVWIQGLVKETKQPVQDDRSYDLVIPNLVVEVSWFCLHTDRCIIISIMES